MISYWFFRCAGMAKADSLKETVVKYPYLFGSQGLSVPSSYLVSPPAAVGEGLGGVGGGYETETGSLNRKKAISSECLHLLTGGDTTPSRESREGWCWYECTFVHTVTELLFFILHMCLNAVHCSLTTFTYWCPLPPSSSFSSPPPLSLSFSLPPSLSPSPPPSPSLPSFIEIKPFSVWWSTNRIDYSLEAPRDLESCTLLPLPAFSHIIHSRYWEAKELVSFILRQVRHLFYICAWHLVCIFKSCWVTNNFVQENNCDSLIASSLVSPDLFVHCKKIGETEDEANDLIWKCVYN